MAKKMKAADAKRPDRVSKDDLLRVLSELSRKEENAKEYQGYLGQATADAVEKHSLDRRAITITRRLVKMETAKRNEFIRSLVWYFYAAGFFDQFDMFNDIVHDLEDILSEIRANNNGSRPADSTTIDTLLN